MDGSESLPYEDASFGGLLQSHHSAATSNDLNLPDAQDYSDLYIAEPFPTHSWMHPGTVNHAHLQDDSPNSSTSSSPKARLGANRARAASLNSKIAPSRSTAHMTQQQINKKRQRATSEQLVVLEEAFMVNPNPDAKVRETISAQISMTERSVQIWFQNRRAKNKMMHKKGGPDEFGQQLGPYGGRPGPPGRSHSIDHGTLSARLDGSLEADSLPDTFVTRLNCRSLTIGTWRRVSCTPTDLVCFFAHNEPKFTYYINSGLSGYMIEYNISAIVSIDLQYLDTPGIKEMGRATISLNSCPIFFMEIPSRGDWKQCTDFTEGEQATTDLTHTLIGPYEQLRQSLAEMKTIYKDKFILTTADQVTALFPNGKLSAGAIGDTTPAPAQNLASDGVVQHGMGNGRMAFGGGLYMPEPKRPGTHSAHRRTRSRSAPIAIDLSFMAQKNAERRQDSYDQYQVRQDGFNIYGNENQSMRNPDYSDGFCTPTTAATSNYQDQWYSASYANTPLLGADSSQLGSPMILNNGQFDLNANTSYVDPFHAFQTMAGLNVLTQHLNSTQALSEGPRLDSVPEIPMAEDDSFPIALQDPMTIDAIPTHLATTNFMPPIGDPSMDGMQP